MELNFNASHQTGTSGAVAHYLPRPAGDTAITHCTGITSAISQLSLCLPNEKKKTVILGEGNFP